METVSVIVPVYNVEKYLRKCVQSITSQTYRDLEIILVDDGAQDKSPEICDQLATQDERIKVIHQTNKGLGLTRNTGLEHATGEFVTFVDSDDAIGENHISDLHSLMCQKGADAVLGFYSSVNQKGVITAKENKLIPGAYEKERLYKAIILPLIGTDETCRYDTLVESSCCMNMYRMAIINQHEIRFTSEREAVAEDQFFNIDYFMHSECVVVSQINDYFYYDNPQSISRKYDTNRFVRTVNYYYLLQRKAIQYGLIEMVGKRIERSFLMKTRVAVRHVVFSNMDFTDKRLEISKILNHELTKKVIQEYPINTYPIHMRTLMILMRKKWVCGVYFLIKAREFMRSLGSLIKSIRHVGMNR